MKQSSIETLTRWQKDMMSKTRGVFVSNYRLFPQAQGFGLDIQLSIDGKSDPEIGDEHFYFYAPSIESCIAQALTQIEKEKQELRKALA